MSLTRPKNESEKSELSFSIDNFDKPLTMSGVEAWSQLLFNLIFTNPGTYPTQPMLGVGIENYEFSDLDITARELAASIQAQRETYLPEVPLQSLKIGTVPKDGVNVLLIQFIFSIASGVETSAIALSTTPDKIIDVDISWQ